MGEFIYNHRFKDAVSDIEPKIDLVGDSEIVLATNDEKIVFKNKSGNLVTVSSDAYNAEQILDFFDGAEYDSNNKKIIFKHGDEVKAEIDASDFIKDGMIDTVKIEDGKLKIIFNTDSGKEEIDIELTDIFNPDNYYTKENVDEFLAEKADTATTYTKVDVDTLLLKKTNREVVNGSNKALIFNETDGGGAKFENADGTDSYVGVNDGGANDIAAQIYAINRTSKEGARIDINPNAMYYTVGPKEADRMVPENEIAVKGDIPTDFYTQEEVDALLAEKEAEYSRLKDMVLDLYYATTYSIPTDCGLDTMLKSKNGEAKLTEDITTGIIAPGTTAKNIVNLKLNGKNITFTGSTTNNPAIMVRNKQQLTIINKGTIDAGGRIAIEANGADCVVTLGGQTMLGARPTYVTDRSSGELIYCYEGTINITNGVFKNLGEDKTYLLNCYDPNYKNGTAKIVVTGGSFYDFNPADNSAEGAHTSFVPAGYHVEESTDGDSTVYTVKKD